MHPVEENEQAHNIRNNEIPCIILFKRKIR